MNQYKVIVIFILFLITTLSAQMTWIQAPQPGWNSRCLFTSEVFDNKMWVMGGDATGGVKNDVWFTTDGNSWTRACSSAPWIIRNDHSSVVYDNKMWVMGGQNASGWLNDVWYSTDGTIWNQAIDSANWLPRHGHNSCVFDNKMWVMGGYASGMSRDVWYSSDGINWTQATATANWSIRYGHTSVAFDNKMWVLGGASSSMMRDVWYSTNGANWTLATQMAAWVGREFHSSVVFDNKIWVMGGYDVGRRNDVWYSSGLNGIEDNNQSFLTNRTLLDAIPNPAKNLTNIRFSLTSNSNVELSIFDISGKLVRNLVDKDMTSGIHQIKWDGTDQFNRPVTEGVYFYTLETPEQKLSNKLILTR